MAGPRSKSGAGFALVVVLCVLVLLTALVTYVSNMSMGERRLAQQYADSTQLTAAADGALRLTLLSIMNSQGDPKQRIAVSNTMSLFGADVLVRVEHEAGRVDINAAPQSLIYAVFKAAGWQDDDAKKIAARIIDRRGSNWSSGAELTGSGSVFSADGLRKASFESVEELRQVVGADNIDDQLLDAFTVYTHQTQPNQRLAISLVMKALQLAEAEKLDGREWLEQSSLEADVNQASAATHVDTSELVRLSACVLTLQTSVCRTVVARVTGKQADPYQTFVWR